MVVTRQLSIVNYQLLLVPDAARLGKHLRVVGNVRGLVLLMHGQAFRQQQFRAYAHRLRPGNRVCLFPFRHS